jgi:hypothetical protein
VIRTVAKAHRDPGVDELLAVLLGDAAAPTPTVS